MPCQNEIQQFQLYGTPTGGSFALTYDGQTTAAIPYSASNATIETELEALPNIGVGDVAVSGGPLPGSAVIVEFTGSLGETNVSEMTIDGNGLTGGSISASASTSVQGVSGIQGKLDDFWSFDDGTGGNADSVGSNSIGAATGSSSVAGKISNAIQYSSVNVGGSKGNPSGAIASVNHDFTVFGWIKLQSVAGASGAIVGCRNSGGTFLWELDVASSKARAILRTTAGGGTNISVSDTTFGNLSDNTWYFVAMRWDESAFTLSISVNAGTPVAVVGAAGASADAVATLTFGYLPGTNTVVDEFGYCGELLSDSELTEIYNAGAGSTVPFSSGTNESQRITVSGSPGQGSFALSLGAAISAAIPYDSTAEEVEDFLEAMSTIGAGNVSCTGGPLPNSVVDIEFIGAMAATDVDQMTVDDNFLKTSITTTQQGSACSTSSFLLVGVG